MSVFLPDLMLPSLTAVAPELLLSRGVDFLILDFDNTVVPYTTDVPTEQMTAWIRRMQASKVRICVVSNSRKPRVQVFCREYGIDCITRARKPFHRGINEALARFRLTRAQTALAGDQIYTDVLGANTAGLTSILVPAIHNHTVLLKLRHVLELPFIGAARLRSCVYNTKKQQKL